MNEDEDEEEEEDGEMDAQKTKEIQEFLEAKEYETTAIQESANASGATPAE